VYIFYLFSLEFIFLNTLVLCNLFMHNLCYFNTKKCWISI